jgi:hypothetical protein
MSIEGWLRARIETALSKNVENWNPKKPVKAPVREVFLAARKPAADSNRNGVRYGVATARLSN